MPDLGTLLPYIVAAGLFGGSLWFGKGAIDKAIEVYLSWRGLVTVPKETVNAVPTMEETFTAAQTALKYFEAKGCAAGCAKARELGAHLFSDPKAAA
jgi:hypothetical protein